MKGEKEGNMVDEERIKKANQILTNITLNTEFEFINERGRLVLRRDITTLSAVVLTIGGFLFAFGIITSLYILIILGLLAFGFVVFSEFIIKNYIVIDYNNGNLYYDRRINDNSISQKIICKLKDIVAVGVNNKFRHPMKGDKAEDREKGYVIQSAIALLKKDGTILYLKSFSDNSKNYDNNCYLSDAISELLNIPQKNCDYSKQLKVINIGTGFQFQETLLQHGSEVVDFAKTIGISIAVSILAVILLILYMNYSD